MAYFSIFCSGVLAICLLQTADAFPKDGKETLELNFQSPNISNIRWVALTLRPGAKIDFKGHCISKADVEGVVLHYHLVVTPCARLLDQAEPEQMLGRTFEPSGSYEVYGTKMVELQLACPSSQEEFDKQTADKVWANDKTWQMSCGKPSLTHPNTTTAAPSGSGATASKTPSKRSVHVSADWPLISSLLSKIQHSRSARANQPYLNRSWSDEEGVCTTKNKSVFGLVFYATKPMQSGNVTVIVDTEMRNSWGFLAALDYPFLTFYGIMTGVYGVYALAWVIAMMCQYKDLLRVQFWIGAVIALGMIEKVFFFSQYNAVNIDGSEGITLLMVAEFVSVAKRTLARLLVIVISLGFGIVKPRLGPSLVWVTGIGMIYFMAALVEGVSRATSSSENNGSGTRSNVTTLVIYLLDVAIVYYVYASITDTMRTLRLRRNTIKLSLYRHFSNAIIFAVVASAAFGTWAYIEFGPATCIRNWQEMWLLEGFWHILFCFLLLVMMILWRPSANNNRYAYSPLVDLAGNDDEPEQMPSEAFDGMKLRNVGQERKTAPVNTVDDDLKWVEENIPTSLADAAVPVLMDSEDELTISRFEVSKML